MDYLKTALLAAGLFFILFLMARAMGHRRISELNLFHCICGITIGSIATELASELESPLKPFIALIVYTLTAMLFSLITVKSVALRKPILILESGRPQRGNRKKVKMSVNELPRFCRDAGCFDLSTSGKRPVTPQNMGLTPKQEKPFYAVISDGQVLQDKLKQLGLDEKWLCAELKGKGCTDVGEVFLGTCDEDKNLELYMIL